MSTWTSHKTTHSLPIRARYGVSFVDSNFWFVFSLSHCSDVGNILLYWTTKIAKFMRPTWGPSGSCQPQMGPMLAPWTLLSGYAIAATNCSTSYCAVATCLDWMWCIACLHIVWKLEISIPCHPSLQPVVELLLHEYHMALVEWLTFCRLHIQMYFLYRQSIDFNSYFTAICPKGSIGSGNGMARNKWGAITWTNDDTDQRYLPMWVEYKKHLVLEWKVPK